MKFYCDSISRKAMYGRDYPNNECDKAINTSWNTASEIFSVAGRDEVPTWLESICNSHTECWMQRHLFLSLLYCSVLVALKHTIKRKKLTTLTIPNMANVLVIIAEAREHLTHVARSTIQVIATKEVPFLKLWLMNIVYFQTGYAKHNLRRIKIYCKEAI